MSPSPMPRNGGVTLSDRIRAVIEAEISAGHLVAGSRVDEQMLMERFEVSRTPAREALLQLLAAGLLTSVPRHGAVVSTLSLSEYVAILEVLMELEGLAARLAARRMPTAQRKLLAQAHAACREAAQTGDAQVYGQANRVFHETLYDGSLNDVLAKQLRAMRLRVRHPQRTLFDRPGRIRDSIVEHDAVLQAILNGEEDAAYRAMTQHISNGGNLYADAIASMPHNALLNAAAPAPLAIDPPVHARPAAGRRRKTTPTPTKAKT